MQEPSARPRRTQRRTVAKIAAILLGLGLLAGAWAIVAGRDDPGSSALAPGPGVGADAPTALTAVCTADGPVLNDDVVQVGPAGLPVEFRNDTDLPASFLISTEVGLGGGSGTLVLPGQRQNQVVLLPPGPATVECGANSADRRSVDVLLADPQGLYSSIELDCGSRGQLVADLTGDGPPVASAEDALRDLLSDDALADHDVQRAGYPQSDPRPYVVRQDGRIVARPGFRSHARRPRRRRARRLSGSDALPLIGPDAGVRSAAFGRDRHRHLDRRRLGQVLVLVSTGELAT